MLWASAGDLIIHFGIVVDDLAESPLAADPANKLYWRFNMRRLTAEGLVAGESAVRNEEYAIPVQDGAAQVIRGVAGEGRAGL